MAISEAIKYLLHKLKVIQNEKDELNRMNNELEDKIFRIEKDYEKNQLSMLNELNNNEKTRNAQSEIVEKLQNENENYLKRLNELEYKFNEETIKYKNIIEKLEKELDIKASFIVTLTKKLDNSEDKEKYFCDDLKNIRLEYEEKLKIFEKENLKLHQELVINENNYKKLIKNLEILIYKVNLENFDLKEKLNKKLQREITENKPKEYNYFTKQKVSQSKFEETNCITDSDKKEGYNLYHHDVQGLIDVKTSLNVDKEIEDIEKHHAQYNKIKLGSLVKMTI